MRGFCSLVASDACPLTPPPENCRPTLTLEAPTALPTRLTPDGNGVYDDTGLELRVRVDRPGPECDAPPSVYLLRADLTLFAGDGYKTPGDKLRAFKHEMLLDPLNGDRDGWRIPLRFSWDGRDASGTLPVGDAEATGEWSVRVGTLDLPSGKVRTVREEASHGPMVQLGQMPDASEQAWLAARGMLEQIGSDPDAPEGEPRWKFHDADPALLDAYASAMVTAGHVDLAASFDTQLSEVMADARLVVKPNDGQIALWRELYLGSSGRVSVAWSDAGTPLIVAGLDAGLGQGSPEHVAETWVQRFAEELRTLLRMAPHEELRRGDTVMSSDGSFALVFFRHHLQGGTPNDDLDPFRDWEVIGDFLAVRVRLAGMPQGAARVVGATAQWNPVGRVPLAAIDEKQARLLAETASGFVAPYVVEVEGPVLHVPELGRAELQYRVIVGEDRQQRMLVAVIDAEAGVVLRTEDAIRTATPQRVQIGVCPGDEGDPYRRVLAGLPYTDVYLPAAPDGTRRRTDARGCYTPVDSSGNPVATAEATLRGAFYANYSWEEHAPDYAWHPAYEGPIGNTTDPFATLDLGPLDAAVDIDRKAEDFFDATTYLHLTYQADLLRRSGLCSKLGDRPARFQVHWGPLGDWDCVVGNDLDCHGCRGMPDVDDYCKVDAHWDLSERGDEDDRCEPGLDDPGCDDEVGVRLMCLPGYSMPGAPAGHGVCDWDRYDGAHVASGGCFNPVTRRATGGGNCIYLERHRRTCIDPSGCRNLRDAAGAVPQWRPNPHFVADQIEYAIPHENMHHVLWSADFFHGADTSHGKLAGHVSEAIPDAAALFYYPHLLFWNNNYDYDRLWWSTSWFGGDPITGGGCSGGSEGDCTLDNFLCDTSWASPTCDKRRCYEPCWADSGPPDRLSCEECEERFPDLFPACTAGGALAWRAIDVHGNGGWLIAALGRYVLQLGRARALAGLAGLISAGMNGSTRATDGPNSLYEKLAVQAAGPHSYPGRTKVEAWRAFMYSTWYADRWWGATALPYRADMDSDLDFHGAVMQPAYDSFAVGHLQAEGYVEAGITDVDTHTAYLSGERAHSVRLTVSGPAALSLWVTFDQTPGGPRPPVAQVIPSTSGTRTETFFFPKYSGYYSFIVGRASPDVSEASRYVLDLDAGDDYPDRSSEAVAIPPQHAVRGEMRRADADSDADAFRFFLPSGELAYVEVSRLSGSVPPAVFVDGIVCPWVGPGRNYCEVLVGPGRPSGEWPVIRVVQNTGYSPDPVSTYAFRVVPQGGALRLPCAGDKPPGAAVPDVNPVCRLNDAASARADGPLFSSRLSTPDEVHNLWLETVRGRVYALRYRGTATVSLYPGTAMGQDPAERPGVSPRALFFIDHDDRHPHDHTVSSYTDGVAFVAPHDGYWRVQVRPVAGEFGEGLGAYQLQVLAGGYSEPDWVDIEHMYGQPGESCP